MKYIVVEELKTPTQLFSFLSLGSFGAAAACFLLLSSFSSLVHPLLVPAYQAVNAVLSLLLVVPSPWNRKKKLMHTLLYFLLRDRAEYHPIYNEKEFADDVLTQDQAA